MYTSTKYSFLCYSGVSEITLTRPWYRRIKFHGMKFPLLNSPHCIWLSRNAKWYVSEIHSVKVEKKFFIIYFKLKEKVKIKVTKYYAGTISDTHIEKPHKNIL